MGPVVDLSDPLIRSLLDRCDFDAARGPRTCAVSGGADSLALLVLAAATGAPVTAVHVDHGLRPGAATEADRVASVADAVGAQFRSERVEVTPGSNLEARARQARFAVLPVDVCTGHTADDRAESMILNLLRGAGPTGMAGMSRSSRRPLLDLRRAETHALCARFGLDVLEDPSNDDPRFTRNRVRHEVLPLLESVAGRDPVPVLVRQADLFAGLADVVDEGAGALDPTRAAVLAEAPEALAGAAVQQWLRAAGVGSGYSVDQSAVARVLAVARHEVVATEVTGGWRVARSGGRLSLTAPEPCKDAAHG